MQQAVHSQPAGRGNNPPAGCRRLLVHGVHGLLAVLCGLVALAPAGDAVAAGHRTANFVVEAPTEALARRIGDAAEQYRHDLAIEWTGGPLPRWSRPCPIHAQVAPHLGAGGATSFVFDNGEVFNWTMTIQGSEQRILDSVLPHEITHTIFASHFRRPLPRWADEGACTTVEHPVERARQHRLLIEFLTTGRGIAFPQMFAMREYPADVLPLYSQGYSLARYLIERGGRHKYVAFVGDGLTGDDWSGALRKHYAVSSVPHLQHEWLEWVKLGCPAPPASVAVADARPADRGRQPRGQSPDPAAPPAAPVSPVAVASTSGRRSIYALHARRLAGDRPLAQPAAGEAQPDAGGTAQPAAGDAQPAAGDAQPPAANASPHGVR